MMNVCLFGVGLIGRVHAGNLARHPRVRLRYIVDPNRTAAAEVAAITGAEIADTGTVMNDPSVKMVFIASATRTHADLAMAAAANGKAIFCEKPIDLDLKRTDECLAAVEKAGVPFQIGFNRRFDPQFARLKQQLAARSARSSRSLSPAATQSPKRKTRWPAAGVSFAK